MAGWIRPSAIEAADLLEGFEWLHARWLERAQDQPTSEANLCAVQLRQELDILRLKVTNLIEQRNALSLWCRESIQQNQQGGRHQRNRDDVREKP